MAAKPKFTRIPKVPELISSGVPAEAISTYCALADHANNKTGLCWPKMETIAQILNRSARTIQRHLHLLRELGLVEFVERRRHKGRFSSYTYKILHIVTTGHTKRLAKRRPIYRGTKPVLTTSKSPIKEGYEWLFGEDVSPNHTKTPTEEHNSQKAEQQKRRTEGYEWLFH